MAVKKTQLYASLWASCDKLRGGMDSSEYKDYILTLLFMKYVTDKFKNKGAYEDIRVFDKAHDKDPDPEKRTGCSFDDFIALKGKKNIGEGMDKIIARLADENTDLKGVIDIAHFNDEKKLGSGKEMVDKLTDLISIFQRPELDFSRNKTEGDDIIGDAYEYLMRKFATESGKSKGQFYTPAEVSRILANVVGISRCTDTSATVCDPACGSGSLLIRAIDAAPIPIMGYGQEKESTTAGLAKMNAVLHRKAEITIKSGNTFSNPQYLDKSDNSILERFDYIVANPPFSMKNWRDGIAGKEYGRFEGYGDTPPEKNGDYAWLMHKLRDNDLLDTVIELAGQCLNMGFEIALDDASQNNKVFSPPNWTKAKASLRDIRTAVKQYLMTVRMTPGGKDILDKLNTGLKMSNDDFESRWSAD